MKFIFQKLVLVLVSAGQNTILTFQKNHFSYRIRNPFDRCLIMIAGIPENDSP